MYAANKSKCPCFHETKQARLKIWVLLYFVQYFVLYSVFFSPFIVNELETIHA